MTPPAPYEPRRFIHGDRGPVVIVPARIAAWLEDHIPTLADLRAAVRGHDPELDSVLNALRVAATTARGSSARGSCTTEGPEAAPRSTLSTRQAADIANISDRAVRYAISQGRLNAHRVGDRWQIDRKDLAHWRNP